MLYELIETEVCEFQALPEATGDVPGGRMQAATEQPFSRDMGSGKDMRHNLLTLPWPGPSGMGEHPHAAYFVLYTDLWFLRL